MENDKDKKLKRSQSSIKSRNKKIASMSQDELKIWKQKQSEASKKSRAKRLAAMSENERVAYKKTAAEKLKLHYKIKIEKNLELKAEHHADLIIAQIG